MAIGEASSMKKTVTEIQCKKCQFIQPIGDRACHRCGLLFSVAERLPSTHRFDGLPNSTLADTLRAQWEQVRQDPENVEAHQRFIDLCHASGHIQFAGFCYRTALANAETDAATERWKSYQATVIKRATAVMAASAPVRSGGGLTHQLVMLSIGALLVLGLAFLYFHWSQSSTLIQGAP